MTRPCGCNGAVSGDAIALSSNITSAQQAELLECPATVNETVCIQANVTITPTVAVGDIQSFCVGSPNIGACPGTRSPTNSCVLTVSQNICVQVPLTFSANAAAAPTGIVCGTPLAGSCPVATNCTLSKGYYATHSGLTNSLITDAGGSIVLGIDNQGASYVVTIANANNVLNSNTPSPPAPATEPFKNQYEELYAQLLAANLNILNGAVCDPAIIAINNANAFIASSPYGVGKAGAPLYQAPLAQFNTGATPGCPAHCPGT